MLFKGKYDIVKTKHLSFLRFVLVFVYVEQQDPYLNANYSDWFIGLLGTFKFILIQSDENICAFSAIIN